MQKAPTPDQEQTHTVSFLREVLSRLAAFKLPPTPENFAWVYRQLQREHNMPVSAEYVNDLAILEHAINAFDQLFVADSWLNAKLSEMRETLGSKALAENKKRQAIKQALEEIVQRKEELLYHLAEASLALKSSVTEVVREIGKLSSSVGGFQTNLSKYQELVDNCHDITDARRVMSLVAHDTKKLNDSLVDHEEAMNKNFVKLQESGALILANLNSQPQPAAAEGADDERHGVSPTALATEALLKRVREAEFANGVLLLVELSDHNADKDRVRRFSELLATKVDRGMLLGYWGGSQFVFVMPQVGPARALVMAREIGKEVERLTREQPATGLTFSYGIAGYQNNDHNGQAFYKAFELAFGNLRPMKDVIAA